MKREAVDSSVIASMGYDHKKEILEIEFHYRGAVYQYDDVPPEVWEEFLESESKGKYFNENIRHDYFETRVE
jgi:hypothetical protein